MHLWNVGELGDDLDPRLDAYLDGWQKFLLETGAEVIYSEARVYSVKMNFAGTLDSIINIRMANRLCDIKTGEAVPRTVGPQTAAYNEAWHEMTGQRRMRRMCVQLKPNGYNVIHLNDPNDWNIYKAALTLHRWNTGD